MTSLSVVLSYSAFLIHSKSQTQTDNAHQEIGSEGAAPHGLPYSAALRKFYECFESFLDDHKENAMNATFVEPNRFYWARTAGRHETPVFLTDNVDTHAVNWYIALLNSALGVHVPRQAIYWDDFPAPVVDFWAGLSDEAWEAFRDPDHFGSSWRGIPRIARGGSQLIRNRNLLGGYLPHNPPCERNHKTTCLGAAMNADLRPASRFANEAVNPAAPVQQRVCFARYLERFAWCFSRAFFVRKCFEALNSEQKPEHAGVRAAMETLFAEYRLHSSSGVPADVESYVEHCYADDMYMELGIEKTARFFEWLGIVKPAGDINTSAEALGSSASTSMLGCLDGLPQGDIGGDDDEELQLGLALSLAECRGMDTQMVRNARAWPEREPWSCAACTFINEPSYLSCDICATQRAVACH